MQLISNMKSQEVGISEDEGVGEFRATYLLAGEGRNGYDAGGNQTAVTDPLGKTTYHEYDPMNRLTGESAPDGVSTYHQYDMVGTRTTVAVSVPSEPSVATYYRSGHLTCTAK